MKNNFLKKFNEDEGFRNKSVLSLVIIIGIVALILNFRNLGNIMSNSLKDKDAESIDNLYKIYDELKKSGKLVGDPTANKTNTTTINNTSTIANDGKDTDGDSISDYDEVNIFNTSMYLKDSDGDRLNDDKEIKDGTNPNCAEGTQCSVTTTASIEGSSYGQNTTSQNTLDLNSLDISKIREELKKIAPDSVKDMVDTMTDEQVRTIFTELYQNQNTNTTNNTNTTQGYVEELKSKLPEFTPQQISMMKDMEESEIVDILVESGIADKSFLSQFKSGEIKSTVINQ